MTTGRINQITVLSKNSGSTRPASLFFRVFFRFKKAFSATFFASPHRERPSRRVESSQLDGRGQRCWTQLPATDLDFQRSETPISFWLFSKLCHRKAESATATTQFFKNSSFLKNVGRNPSPLANLLDGLQDIHAKPRRFSFHELTPPRLMLPFSLLFPLVWTCIFFVYFVCMETRLNAKNRLIPRDAIFLGFS